MSEHTRPGEYDIRMWTDPTEQLLIQWKSAVGKNIDGHSKQAEIFKKWSRWTEIPPIVGTAIAGAAQGFIFDECGTETTGEICVAYPYIRLGLAIFVILMSAYAAVSKYLNFSERAENHKRAVDDYTGLKLKIDQTRKTPVEIRGDPIEVLTNIRETFTDVTHNSPSVPSRYYEELNNKSSYAVRKITGSMMSPRFGSMPSEVFPRNSGTIAKSANDSSTHTSNIDGSDTIIVDFDLNEVRAPSIVNRMSMNSDFVNPMLAYEMERLGHSHFIQEQPLGKVPGLAFPIGLQQSAENGATDVYNIDSPKDSDKEQKQSRGPNVTFDLPSDAKSSAPRTASEWVDRDEIESSSEITGVSSSDQITSEDSS